MPSPVSSAQAKQLKKLGERIKTIRKSKGLTMEQVAYAIGKDRQSIGRLESGKINPSYIYLEEICIGLEIKISELFKVD